MCHRGERVWIMAASMTMSVVDWIAVPDNPRQRNTERRAAIARGKHLKEYSKIHDVVYAATIGGEVACKLDGHTRAYLWKDGSLESPPSGKVLVILLDVENMAEAKELYDMLDARGPLKTPSDVIFGATRENRFQLVSPLLNRCQFATQLKLAASGKKFEGNTAGLLRQWKPILLQLDSLGLSRRYSVMICVMLTTIKKDGFEVASEFWRALDRDAGTKTDKGRDGVQALSELFHVRKSSGCIAGYENLIAIAGKALYCYEMWKDGRRIPRNIGMRDFSEFVSTMNAKSKEHA